MATTKRRINISLSDELNKILSSVSKRDGAPIATTAVSLLESALAAEEDVLWAELADERLSKKTKWLTHKEVWGK